MTITSTVTSNQAPGNGSARIFTAPMKIFSATDIVVGFIVNGGYTLITTGYSVTNVDVNGGCTVTFDTAPPVGTTVDIRTNTPQTQGTEFANLGSYLPNNTTDTCDQIVRMVQDLTRKTYTFGFHGPDTESIAWPAFPSAALRANLQPIFDSNGLPTLGVPSTQIITTNLLAGFLNLGMTAAEQSAGVTLVNLAYQPLDPHRYGAVGDGLTDDTTALTNWAAVVNAQAGQTATWPVGATYLTGPLPIITANNFTLKANGSVIKVKADSWGTTGDGSTQLLITGTYARLHDLKIDGNQSLFTAPPVGRLIQLSGNNVRLDNCSFFNSPSIAARAGLNYGKIISCHFDSNAGLGIELDTCAYLDFIGCTFNFNGYGFHQTFATNTFVAMGFVARFRSHHITLTSCQAFQNGRDGFFTNQGSYAMKFIGCIAWMNDDGGFTLAADVTTAGTVPGDGESPYDVEYIDCEAYNNYCSGLAAYNAAHNVSVIGGRYYNNHRVAGLLSDQSSYNCGLYFTAGCIGTKVDTKAYDDRQLCGISAVTGSGTTRTLTATNWGAFSGAFISTMGNYPQVAVYDASGNFNGYGTIIAESSGSVTIQATPNNGVSLGSIGPSWSVTQRLQHNGCMMDNGCQSYVNIDGFGQLPGSSGIYGYKVFSGPNTNGQNILLPWPLDPNVELLLNPSFETDTSNWSLTAASGGSAGRVTTTRRSVGSLQLVGGTSAQSTANATLDSNALLYAANAFIEYSMWVYANLAGDGGILFDWIISSVNITTTVNHPGGGWKLLKIGAFVPSNATGIVCNCFANAGKTVFFDVGSLRVRQEPTDNRDYIYPSRGLPV
jgi:hypothetical protein